MVFLCAFKYLLRYVLFAAERWLVPSHMHFSENGYAPTIRSRHCTQIKYYIYVRRVRHTTTTPIYLSLFVVISPYNSNVNTFAAFFRSSHSSFLFLFILIPFRCWRFAHITAERATAAIRFDCEYCQPTRRTDSLDFWMIIGWDRRAENAIAIT